MMIQLKIDGKNINARKGEPLVDVALKNDIYIPTLCYTTGQACLGTCRVCSVKVDGVVTAACTVPVAHGMDVEVNEPEVTDMRKALVESLFAEGTHNCPSCEKSGRCDLQAVGYEVGMMVSRFEYRFTPRRRDYASDKILLERDRCIFCQRCVDFVRDEETGQKIFSISGRGANSRIEINAEFANKMTAEQVTRAVNLCPVGTIVEKGVGFNDPIGKRKFEIKSVRERALEGGPK
ncbi:MAG: (2Fe-2S)-binding protein [Gammaproteobacteria bacterium]|uniref:2Fe-2S iron-sulfur cluster-binding protein n=1 Tax=Rhodoferax sp. TaxID=50421 RepID=UPI001807AD8C|nr:2Fe-2S iron-sulfur cluster-binding protein [Rhodoferax sp.]MBU3899462.1 (2Fe-2S)-binding protein [Gammaproteobacteria bacterium]MBA3057238.1 2Fe-2S iron-sulfur cluster binding domain-containing protein [Rhodoferax sp.]MBU3996366.1 (2Fe-2S)-binding protein [Gammaproteobacteria bacterium]MBU4080717.1 (2Fe-2S)-binding protein [Gammaproteobacteria bacterium]MBU4113493.1 (2Fe-2S)-binding protein [Gammaproteobacteria bacterium]